MEFRIGEVLAGDTAGDADAAEAHVLDRVLDLLRGKVGELQRGGREGDEAVLVAGAELDQRFVLHLDQLFGGVALGAVPERIDAERLDIDARPVHLCEAGADIRPQEARRFERMIDDLRGVRDDAMSVDIDGLDALAGDHDLPALGVVVGMPRAATRAGACPGGNFAAGENEAAGHIGADRHEVPP